MLRLDVRVDVAVVKTTRWAVYASSSTSVGFLVR